MAPASGMSITLPRNFAPMGLDGVDEPRTPDQTFAELQLPPPPPHHSTMRVRRPRSNMDNFTSRNNALPATLFASDIPIPSIEVPRATATARPAWHHNTTQPSPSEKLRAASYRNGPLPQTPPAQTKSPDQEIEHVDWDRQRSSSSCSTRSDASFSSSSSFTSRPTSFGGSATSPECDIQDPFMPRSFNLIPATPTKRSRSAHLETKPAATRFRWTTEMDNHLWNVYQMYLADPSITPFKAAPGVTPPIGVCNRVARVARRTWPKATKIPHQIVKRHSFRDVMDDAYAVRERTPKMSDTIDSPEGTPRHFYPFTSKSQFPDKNVTRRRFKELCKQKFSITPHYQRLRESRSPSPFTDHFSHQSSRLRISRAATRQASASYATRDLGISLVASGATGALAQLVTGDSPPPQSDEWFNTPVVTSSEATSSPPTGLGIDSDGLAPASSVPRLASPFSYNTWDGPSRPRREPLPDINHYDTISATGSRLLSPVRLDPFSNAHKRRAQHQLEGELSPGGSDIQHQLARQELVFTGVGDISQRRIRLRNRGATLGAASDGRDRLHRLFSPPPTLEQPDLSTAAVGPPPSANLAPPEPDDRHKRLGSPFELEANKRSNRTKSPRHIPSLSDPFVSVSNPFASNSASQSIGERLATFSALQNHSPNNHGLF
jgi:hypothetical protein